MYWYGTAVDGCSGSELHYAEKRWYEVSYGVCPPQRKRVLSGAQCAPRWESASTASRTARGTRANHGRCGAPSFQETPLCGVELAGSARASEQPAGSVQTRFPGDPEARSDVASIESRPGGPVSA